MPNFTANLNLNKPIVNSATDEDLWGGQLNDNMDTIDSEFATATINKDYADKVVSAADVKDFQETTYNLGGTISGTLTIDYTDGHYQYGTVSGDITSVVINNFPASGKNGFLSIELEQDGTGGHSITLSSAFKTSGGATVALSTTAGAIDILRFETRDAGTTIYTFINQDMQ